MSGIRKIRETITTDFKGEAIQGERVITGVTKLNQFVIFQGRCILDSNGYTQEQKDGLMLMVAGQILFQLASGRCLDAKPSSDYGF